METKLKTPVAALIFITACFCLVMIAGNRLSFATSEVTWFLDNTDVAMTNDYGNTFQPLIQSDKSIIKAKLIKKVEPSYPVEASKKGLMDTVVVQGKTDKEGNVVKVEVLKGDYDLLNKAAVEAIKQWKYEPMQIDGNPVAIAFTVSCRFWEDPQKKKTVSTKSAQAPEGESPPVQALGTIKQPKLIKKVEPVYPKEALKNNIKGVVIVEATTNAKGEVIASSILKSVPGLDEATLDAIKQWKFEPFYIDEKPRGLIFTVTLRFQLR